MKIEIEKPVIPQFVAEWIEKEKKGTPFHKSFARAINMITHDDDWKRWEYKVGNRWSRLLAIAWLQGYEVDQQPLYYAKIKGWELASSRSVFWNYHSIIESPMLPRLYTGNKEDKVYIKTKMTIEDWNKRGINDTNADFEAVE